MSDISYQSLHFHTTVSDGKFSYEEALEKTKDYGFGLIAFTDHDQMMTVEDFQRLKNINSPINFIAGIELTIGYIDDEKTIRIPGFHVVGLPLDLENPALKAHCDQEKNNRINQAKVIVSQLKENGFDIDWSGVQSFQGVPGRPHIVDALLKKERNVEILDMAMQRLREEAKSNPVWQEKLPIIESHNNFNRFFDLYLSNTDPFVKGVYVPAENYLTLNKGVELIRGAGGLAIIAHYSAYKNEVSLELCEQLAKEKRIDGFETIYGFWDKGEEYREHLEDMKELVKICEKYNLVQSGGVDCHRVEDLQRATDSEHITELKKTGSLWQSVASKHSHLDLTWTTLI